MKALLKSPKFIALISIVIGGIASVYFGADRSKVEKIVASCAASQDAETTKDASR